MSIASQDDIVDCLIEAFRASGMNQQQLAEASGVHFVTLNRIINRNQHPTMGVADKLARSLGLELRLAPLSKKR